MRNKSLIAGHHARVDIPQDCDHLTCFNGVFDKCCCLVCQPTLHDPGAYNQCREPQAERVLDKDRGNFCDWFRFRDAATGNGTGGGKGSAEDRLKALFKPS